jgi:molecular chaperone GrpE (heat shock protein)
MKQEKELLRRKFIDFQRQIAELRLEIRTREDSFLARERGLYAGLFEVLDAFESLEETLQAKEEGMDKTARLMAKNIRAIHRKLNRMIAANHISRMEFPDNIARMDCCKVVDTQEAPDLEDETIITVVKSGYIHDELGTVLRKAEVITVLNGP